MSKRILFIHIIIVILKIFFTSIIWRVNINHINLTLVRIGKSGKGFEVVALDKDMVGRIGFGADESLCGVFHQYRQLLA